MMGKKREGNLTIWFNVWKEDKQPDFRGKMDIGNNTYDLSLWINTELGGSPVHLSGEVTKSEKNDESSQRK